MAEKGDKILSFMKEWAENYIRSRDAFKKEIILITSKQNGLSITFKDRKEEIIIIPQLEQLKTESITNNTSFITLNDKQNVDWLCDNWSKLASVPAIKVYFINPFSTTDKKWIINPHVHAKICDEGALKTGLQAMFETVEPISVDILQTRL